MMVIADLCVVPIGIGTSVSKEVAACERVLAEAGLKTKLHAYGANIEGQWDEVFATIKRHSAGGKYWRVPSHVFETASYRNIAGQDAALLDRVLNGACVAATRFQSQRSRCEARKKVADYSRNLLRRGLVQFAADVGPELFYHEAQGIVAYLGAPDI